MSSAGLSFASGGGMTAGMDKSHDARAERLAAKLRENLKRRKAQARVMDANRGGAMPDDPDRESPDGADGR